MKGLKYPTIEELEQMDADQQGWCVSCGEVQDGCEPDARKYECECCGAYAVWGAAELALMGWYDREGEV